jgi:hypothetical protein
MVKQILKEADFNLVVDTFTFISRVFFSPTQILKLNCNRTTLKKLSKKVCLNSQKNIEKHVLKDVPK